ncbi:MAG: hypothetical protein V1854_07915 [Methanobacteriota archaeon]
MIRWSLCGICFSIAFTALISGIMPSCTESATGFASRLGLMTDRSGVCPIESCVNPLGSFAHQMLNG